MKKYPLTWFFVIGIANIIFVLTAWRFVDYFADIGQKHNAIFGIYLGLSSILWLILLFKFWDKFLRLEGKTRNKNFENKVKTGKPITLVIKRNIFANLSLIFGAVFLYIVFIALFPSKEFSSIGYTVARIGGILWFVYGLLFSVIFQKKKLVFENGQFTVLHASGIDIIKPNELKSINLKIKNEKPKTSEEKFRQLLFADLEIELSSGKELLLTKADKTFGLNKKIKTIQKLCN